MQRCTTAHREFIEELRLAPNFLATWKILHDALGQFGIQSITYGFIPHVHPNDPRPMSPLLVSTRCSAFMAYYDEAGHLEHDFNMHHCATTLQPLILYNRELMARLTPRQRQVELDAYDFGQRRARQKLSAHTLTQAIARAAPLGLLEEMPFAEPSKASRVGVDTVIRHLLNARKKLAARNTTQAVTKALALGLLKLPGSRPVISR